MSDDLFTESNVDVLESNSFPQFQNSETYDGLSSSTRESMAEDGYIREDNPMYIGGIQLLRDDENNFLARIGGAEFVSENAEQSDWFEKRYGAVTPVTAAQYIADYYIESRNAIGPQSTPNDYTWFAKVIKRPSYYKIRLIWSKQDVDSVEEIRDKSV